MFTRFMDLRRTAFRTSRVPLFVIGGVLFLGGSAEALGSTGTPQVRLFMEQGGWCWFQDPRAIIQNEKFFIGSVQGNEAGSLVVGVYDLASDKLQGRVTLRESFDHDDHNAPAFYSRPDGSVLAVYARHHVDFFHYSRVSDPNNPLDWSEERGFEHDYPRAGKVTYMNLFYLEEERKLYNFYRGIDFNPCFVVSQDHGDSWGEARHFLMNEVEGYQRPYPRYAGNGVDTIGVSFTDAHPRQFGNSIYYAEFRSGGFYDASGRHIKDLDTGGPLKPSEAERIFQGGGGPGRGNELSAQKAAWTSSVAFDSEGRPHVAYTLYLSNEDNRYRLASWNGQRWVDREVAYGGSCLYDREASYTGLITLDPGDPHRVVISTNVDPSTGKSMGRHEIYAATIGADEDVSVIDWKPLTQQSTESNLRPLVVRGDGYRVVAWLRGRYDTYTDYDLDVVGFVEEFDVSR